MRVCAADAIDFGCLSRAERFGWIQTPDARDESLPPQYFLDPRDASRKAIGRIEERGVRIGDLRATLQKTGRYVSRPRCRLTVGEQPHCRLGPHGPVTEQAANDPALDGFVTRAEAPRREQIHYDVVIIASVERDVVAARFGYRADHVQSLLTVEGRHFDCDDAFDLGKPPPE